MLIPRRVKHRKQHRPDRSGAATGGTRITFGDFGIQAVEHAYVTNRQIESARIAMTRHIRRGGKVWINIFPDRPTRSGRGDADGADAAPEAPAEVTAGAGAAATAPATAPAAAPTTAPTTGEA